jgi:spermidine/putrescine transport system permease protein
VARDPGLRRAGERHAHGLGIIDEPLTFILYNANAVVITLAHAFAPFAILPIFVSLEKIDRSLLEAARDLGESRR